MAINKWLADGMWAQDSRTAELLSKAKLIDLLEALEEFVRSQPCSCVFLAFSEADSVQCARCQALGEPRP